MDASVPAHAGVTSAQDALRENEIDDDDDDDASIDEDLSRDGYRNVGRMSCPNYAHGAGDNSGHAEAEKSSRSKKFVRASRIQLQDRHVRCGAEYKQDEKD